jgi:N6-L-threonylcarbamoyladenine synthase
MKILAIETSCDDTCAAVLVNDRVITSVISSQTDLHSQWGGVVPDIAKRAHSERIKPVIAQALKRAHVMPNSFQHLPHISKKGQIDPAQKIEQIIEQGMNQIDVIAVTIGPGLAIALGVGVNTAKELAQKYQKKLVAVNHIEGHILSNFAKNSQGSPDRQIEFPALALTVSGGHTKIILVNNIGDYQVVGETLDDAAGEALDKAAKQMGLGYPGGPVIERLAQTGDENFLKLPRPMSQFKTFDYSFSGLKTSFYYQIKKWPSSQVQEHLEDLAASYQKAVFDTLLLKYQKAIDKYQPKMLLASGGVMANQKLRHDLRKLAKKVGLKIYLPFKKALNTDNAMMIGVAGYYKALKGEYVQDIAVLDRDPRAPLSSSSSSS